MGVLVTDGSKQRQLTIFRLSPRQLDFLVLHQLALDVGEERGGGLLVYAAAQEALGGAAEHELIPGARHADIEQAALLRGAGGVAEAGWAETERHQAVFETGDEHDRKLEPLGGMQGQERNAVGARIPEHRVRRERRRILQAHAIIAARLRECAEALERDRRAGQLGTPYAGQP